MTVPGRPGLLIAEFARRCRLPVSTLRYYDRIGLLRPAAVEPGTGYRYYSPDQLPQAVLIAGLRSIRTAPGDIASILGGGDAAAATVARERGRIAAEITERTQAMARLDEIVSGPDLAPTGAAQIVDLAASRVPVLGFCAPWSQLPATIVRAVARLRTQLRRRGLQPTGWGALLPLDIDEQVSGQVFARIENDAVIAALPGLQAADLPRGRAIRVTHMGGPDRIALTYAAAMAQLATRGDCPRAPVLEEYATTGDPIRITLPLCNWTPPSDESKHSHH